MLNEVKLSWEGGRKYGIPAPGNGGDVKNPWGAHGEGVARYGEGMGRVRARYGEGMGRVRARLRMLWGGYGEAMETLWEGYGEVLHPHGDPMGIQHP